MESGGKLFWAEPLKEADFLKAAAGGMILLLNLIVLFPEKIHFLQEVWLWHLRRKGLQIMG